MTTEQVVLFAPLAAVRQMARYTDIVSHPIFEPNVMQPIISIESINV